MPAQCEPLLELVPLYYSYVRGVKRAASGSAGGLDSSLGNSAAQSAADDARSPGPAIEVKGLTKSFGRTLVLRDLSLEVPWGQVLTILGPNGSGKSTLIKVLATLAEPDAARIRVAGFDAARAGQSVRRNIGVVTHESLLYDGLTGRENLKFFARMFSLRDVDDRTADASQKLGVASRLDQRVGNMSHGLKKRFSIARALLHDPVILLLDEPESGLDQEALAMLESIVTDPRRTVLMTTHNLERGLSMGHRLAILAGGKIAYEESLGAAAVGAVKDAYSRYSDLPT